MENLGTRIAWRRRSFKRDARESLGDLHPRKKLTRASKWRPWPQRWILVRQVRMRTHRHGLDTYFTPLRQMESAHRQILHPARSSWPCPQISCLKGWTFISSLTRWRPITRRHYTITGITRTTRWRRSRKIGQVRRLASRGQVNTLSTGDPINYFRPSQTGPKTSHRTRDPRPTVRLFGTPWVVCRR